MFGIGLKRKVESLEWDFNLERDYFNAEIKSLREVDQKRLEDYNILRSEFEAMKVRMAEVVAEVQNPPKYKVGDVIAHFTILEVLPILVGSITKRYYKVFSSRSSSVEEILENAICVRENNSK